MLDLPTLMEMLVHQTTEYVDMMKEEGLSERTVAANALLSNIQAAIMSKQARDNAYLPGGSTIVSPQNSNTIQGIGKIT